MASVWASVGLSNGVTSPQVLFEEVLHQLAQRKAEQAASNRNVTASQELQETVVSRESARTQEHIRSTEL